MIRPRIVPLVALVVVPPLLFWWFWQLSIDMASFDPRGAIFFLAWLAYTPLALSSRLVVADQALWRRSLLSRAVVSLDNLATVEIRRGRRKQRDGWPTTVVVVSDHYGRTIKWKLWSWSGRSAPLLSLLDILVRAQGVDVDTKTAARLADAAARHEWRPAWAARTRATTARLTDHQAELMPLLARRNRARPTKRAVVAIALFLVVSVGFTIAAATVGTRVVSDLHCAPNRHLWTTDADVAGAPNDPVDVVGAFTGGEEDWITQGHMRPMPMSHVVGYISAEQASATYARGIQITWGDASNPDAEVDIEEFNSHEAALAYQRAWGQWHCLQPESVFHLENQPGTAGFRYAPRANHAAEEKVGWVRGNTRTEVRWFTDKQNTDQYGLTHFAQSAYLPTGRAPDALTCRQGAAPATASTEGSHLPPSATAMDAIRAALPTLDPRLPIDDYRDTSGPQYALEPTVASVYDATDGSSPVLEHLTYWHVTPQAAPDAMRVTASLTKSGDRWSVTSASWCPA
ncbi:MAG TPA: hypothetical protein VIJ47_10070 [Acidimicrobiales bacterium]